MLSTRTKWEEQKSLPQWYLRFFLVVYGALTQLGSMRFTGTPDTGELSCIKNTF